MTGPDRRTMPYSGSGRFDRADLVFIDLEASGLKLGSWPIQIGLARVHADDSISIDEDLIRPDPNWPEELWSRESAEVHGIPRVKLRPAPEASEIAAFYIPLLRGKILISDAPEFDERWLHLLTSTVDPALRLRIVDFDAVLAATCDAAGIRRAYARLDELPTPHQAGEDAARLAQAWLAGVRG